MKAEQRNPSRAGRGLAVLAAAGLASAGLSLPARGQSALKPGSYETTTEMSMQGMTMPPQKGVVCVKSSDPREFANRPGSQCKISNYKATGNKATFTTTCPNATMQVETTFTADSYVTVVTMAGANGPAHSMRMTAKRIGDCAK